MRDTSGMGVTGYGDELSQVRKLGHKPKPEKAGSGSDAADGWRPADFVLKKLRSVIYKSAGQRADNESVVL